MAKKFLLLIATGIFLIGGLTFSSPTIGASPVQRSIHGEYRNTGKWIPVDSSALTAIRYSYSSGHLDIEFVQGAGYRYFKVPPKIFRRLLNASSKGTYYNNSIKGRYRVRKLWG